jgi:hypothetical protein
MPAMATPALATCAAVVAVEDLAHQRHGKLETPAAAFMGLALADARRLVVGNAAHQPNRQSVPGALHFLAVAPVNVSRLVITGYPSRAEWASIAAALDGNRCHGFMRHRDLRAVPIDASDAAALLTAMNGLAHLRSLQCSGAGAVAPVDAVGGTLRRLELRNCTAAQNFDFARMPLLREVGPLPSLPDSVTSIDLSDLQHLTRIGDHVGQLSPMVVKLCGSRTSEMPLWPPSQSPIDCSCVRCDRSSGAVKAAHCAMK